MTDAVTIFEVGPRDGLQNEAVQIATPDKIKLVDLLSDAGLRRIEVTSFVSARWVPQMADAAAVLGGIQRRNGCAYTALTPNLRGFSEAIDAGVDEVAVFAAASETFSMRNINCSIAESLKRFLPIMDAAKAADVPVRGYISCVTDCPFEGQIAPAAVAGLASELHAMGCFEISLGDTIGHGTPDRVSAMLGEVCNSVPVTAIAGHFHDTKGLALANIVASLEQGVRVFDASAGGLGGCPFAPGAAGNVATEAVVDLLESQGFDTGIDRKKLQAAAAFAQSLRGQG